MRLGLSFSLVHTSGRILCIQFNSIKHNLFSAKKKNEKKKDQNKKKKQKTKAYSI